MNHALRVRVRKSVGDFAQDCAPRGDGQFALAVESGAERLVLHVGHDVVEESFGHAGVEKARMCG